MHERTPPTSILADSVSSLSAYSMVCSSVYRRLGIPGSVKRSEELTAEEKNKEIAKQNYRDVWFE